MVRLIGLHPSGAPGKIIHGEVLSLRAPLAPGQAAHLRTLLEVGAEKPMLSEAWCTPVCEWGRGGFRSQLCGMKVGGQFSRWPVLRGPWCGCG